MIDKAQLRTECDNYPRHCLNQVAELLPTVAVDSLQFYELKLLEFESLFALTEAEQLFAQTSQYILKDELPEYFKIKLYIYHAKSLKNLNRSEESIRFRSQAEQLLNQVNKNFANPELLVELLNLQLYSDFDPALGLRMLQQLDKKFLRRDAPRFKFELYTNLGHFADRCNETQKSVIYREQALRFAYALKSDYKIGEALFNLGSSLQKSGDLSDARQRYMASIEFAERAHDDVGVNLAHLYLANVALQQGQVEEAKTWLSRLSIENLPQPRHQLFVELQTKLSIL
ncbi:tetratricopeptide repeat protein [Pseudoalteromonas tunicata]|uniref:tetratricopeptide repeat protein n=1 Tax=Pseudoalteromonas tunicata TaxID=314281 RepID=UPI00030197DC|nr:tetratricopeptide repeat protein [Pseudoalteromonas tunicata]MDP4984711.1 tetratricopeptide repeat protein [Pseudoalteromonas tunicata]